MLKIFSNGDVLIIILLPYKSFLEFLQKQIVKIGNTVAFLYLITISTIKIKHVREEKPTL